jgi:uncharacterized membrane protein YbhN (UPF0104 family)
LRRNLRTWIYLLFSAAVSIGVLSYLFSQVPPSEVLRMAVGLRWHGFAAFLVCSLAMSLFRLWRYDILLRASGYAAQRFSLFLVVLVRNFFSDLLPARLGTAVYVYLVTTRLGIPFAAAASSFAVSLLLDILAMAPLLLLAGVMLGGSDALLIGALVLGIVTLFLWMMLPWVLNVLASQLLRPFWRRYSWARMLVRAAIGTRCDLRRMQRAGIYGRVFVLSILIRLAKYSGMYFLLYALLAPEGYSFGDLSFARVFIGLSAAELAASTPVSGIAAFGAYEGAWTLAFQLLGFPARIAQLSSLAHHGITQVCGYGFGLIATLLLLVPRLAVLRPLRRRTLPLASASVFAIQLSLALAAWIMATAFSLQW